MLLWVLGQLILYFMGTQFFWRILLDWKFSVLFSIFNVSFKMITSNMTAPASILQFCTVVWLKLLLELQNPVASKMFAHFQFHVWIDLDEILWVTLYSSLYVHRIVVQLCTKVITASIFRASTVTFFLLFWGECTVSFWCNLHFMSIVWQKIWLPFQSWKL